MALTRSDASELNDLAWHWEHAYLVACDGDVFTATRVGNPTHILTAETPVELRQLIRQDYAAWQSRLQERSSL
jgi:hypothetical protein